MILNLLLYFELGVIYEMLVTAYFRFVSRGRAWPASALTMGITMFGFLVLEAVLGEGLNLLFAATYAVGNGVGSFMTLYGGSRGKQAGP